MVSIPPTSSGILTQALQVMQLCLHIGSDWYGWTIIMNYKNWHDCLWVAVSRYLMFIFFPYSSWRPAYFKVKHLVQTHQWSGPRNRIASQNHFLQGFLSGISCKQNRHTGLQTLWLSLLLIIKWPTLSSHLFNTTVSAPPQDILSFFQSFLRSFWVDLRFFFLVDTKMFQGVSKATSLSLINIHEYGSLVYSLCNYNFNQYVLLFFFITNEVKITINYPG